MVGPYLSSDTLCTGTAIATPSEAYHRVVFNGVQGDYAILSTAQHSSFHAAPQDSVACGTLVLHTPHRDFGKDEWAAFTVRCMSASMGAALGTPSETMALLGIGMAMRFNQVVHSDLKQADW